MTNDSKNSKPFLYLVQSSGKLPESYNDLQSESSDVVCLTWKEEVEGAIYFPKSTWTEGRNRLYEEAVKDSSYLYYIFLDDDVTFAKGSWREFEAALLKYQPAVAVPYLIGYESGAAFNNLRLKTQTCYNFDAIYNAFHRDVLLDGVILPYYGGFDKECLLYSQWIVIHLALLFFPRHTLQINSVAIQNENHDAVYPNYNPKRIRKWFRAEILQSPGLLPPNLRQRVARNIPWLPLRRLAWRPRRPSPKLSFYRVSPQQKQKIQLNFREKQPELIVEPSPTSTAKE